MSDNTELWYLENVDLFKFLCPTKLGAVSDERMAEITFHYKKGEFIYFTNEPARKLYLLHTGRIKIGSYSEEGKEIIKAILSPGEIFGEMALAGEKQRRDFAVAMEENTEVCVIGLEEIKQLMADNVDFSLKVARIIGLRLRRTERRLESLVFKDARTRIVEFLRDLATNEGRPVGDEILVRSFLTHKDIASLTATSRQTVTSVLNDLREDNLIYFDRKRLLIRDLEKLK